MSSSAGRSSPAAAQECEFCAIVRGDAAADIICEADSWIAFFPLEPATPGHTLVIPKSHVPHLWDVDTSLGADLMTAIVRVGQAIDHALHPDGMNLITSSGRAAEQTVFHLHLHVVPRWSDDGFGDIWPPEKPMDSVLKDDLADQLREACAVVERTPPSELPEQARSDDYSDG